jgi:hypothetical protein
LELGNVTIVVGDSKAFESSGAIFNGDHEFVGGGEAGVGDVFVLEVHRVAEAFTVGELDVTEVDMVVLWGGIEVPTVDGVECPGSL